MNKENIILLIIFIVIGFMGFIANMGAVVGAAMFWTGYYVHKILYGEE